MAGDSVMAKVADPEVTQAAGRQELTEHERPAADGVTPAADARRARRTTSPSTQQGQQDGSDLAAEPGSAGSGPPPAGSGEPGQASADGTQAGPAETGPAETGPAETADTRGGPAESEAAGTEAVGTEATDTGAAGTGAAGTEAAGTEAAGTEAAGTEAAGTEAAERESEQAGDEAPAPGGRPASGTGAGRRRSGAGGSGRSGTGRGSRRDAPARAAAAGRQALADAGRQAIADASSAAGVRRRLARLGAARGGGVNPVLEPLLKSVRSTHPKADIRLIERAYDVAARQHAGQSRKSGDPYITHPLAVATILAELGMNHETLCAALLHDTIEDTPYTLTELRADGNAPKGLLLTTPKLAPLARNCTAVTHPLESEAVADKTRFGLDR